jgi:hypothetical protein
MPCARSRQGLGAYTGRCLLTQPRSWGLAFNPVSFFYCFEADGQLAAILCEVTNTPWRERYHYVLPAQPLGADTNTSPWPRRFMFRRSAARSGIPHELQPARRRLGVHMADWQGR